MTQRRVVGLDLSLTSTGVSDGHTHHAFRTTPEQCIEERLDIQTQLATDFVFCQGQWAGQWDRGLLRADLVVIEGPSYGSRGPGHEELAALRYMVRTRLHKARIPFAIFPPSVLKLYTTGTGRASKHQMVAAVRERHGVDMTQYKVKDGRYDMADAYALAAMGYARIGQPLPTTGPAPDKYMKSLFWPPLLGL